MNIIALHLLIMLPILMHLVTLVCMVQRLENNFGSNR